MDTLAASAVIERQDCYAVPPNYIERPRRCQRIDDGPNPSITGPP